MSKDWDLFGVETSRISFELFRPMPSDLHCLIYSKTLPQLESHLGLFPCPAKWLLGHYPALLRSNDDLLG